MTPGPRGSGTWKGLVTAGAATITEAELATPAGYLALILFCLLASKQ